MSFQGIKNNFKTILGALGYKESKESFDVEDMSVHEFGNTYIINMLSGESGENAENINTRLYDNQIWRIRIAYKKSEHNDISSRDELYRSIEPLVIKIDNPDNWEGTTNGARTQRYQSWDVEDFETYYVLSVLIEITDTYNY